MKKFYALAAALLATGSMMAVNPATSIQATAGQQAQMSAEGEAMFRAEMAYNDYVAANEIERPGSQKFSWTDAGGTVWNATFMENGNWSDNFTSWDGARLYAKISCTLQNDYNSTSDRKTINYMMFYPRLNMWKAEYRPQLFPGYTDKDSLNALPLSYLTQDVWTTNWKGFAVPQVSPNGANNFYIGQTSIGSDDYLVIMNSNTLNSSNQPYFAAGSTMGYCIYNGTRCGANEGSKLEISNFDDETSSMNFHFSGTCNNAAGANIWTYDYNYSGVAFMPGFTKAAMEWTAGNVHIVNVGSVSGEDEEYEAIDDTEWGPLQRFQVLACAPGFTFDNVQLTSGAQMWTSTTWPETPARVEANAKYYWLRGALFSANGTADPFGEWQVSNVQVGFDSMNFPMTTGTPAANTFLYGNVNGDYWPWGESNGMYSVYEGYYWWLPNNTASGAAYNPFIMNGTTEGFGYQGISTYKCQYKIAYKGDITYHYDPTDYLKTRTIKSVGTLAPNVNWGGVNTLFTDGENDINVVAANGTINVTVENAANVAIYNMAGMIINNVNAAAGETVNVYVGNGIYIVKVGNKAVKVAL